MTEAYRRLREAAGRLLMFGRRWHKASSSGDRAAATTVAPAPHVGSPRQTRVAPPRLLLGVVSWRRAAGRSSASSSSR